MMIFSFFECKAREQERQFLRARIRDKRRHRRLVWQREEECHERHEVNEREGIAACECNAQRDR